MSGSLLVVGLVVVFLSGFWFFMFGIGCLVVISLSGSCFLSG